MSCTECVHNIYISVRSQLLSKFLLAFLHSLLCLVVFWSALLNTYRLAFLFWIETKVLKQQSLTWLKSCSRLRSISAVVSELNLYTKALRNLSNNLRKRELWINLTLRLTHVAHHDDCTAISQNLLKSREGTTDTGVVGYITILVQWNVKIYTNDCLLAGKVKLIDCHFTLYINKIKTILYNIYIQRYCKGNKKTQYVVIQYQLFSFFCLEPTLHVSNCNVGFIKEGCQI